MYIGASNLICNALAVNGTAVVRTNAFKLGFGTSFGIEVVCATGTTPAIKIQLEECVIQAIPAAFVEGNSYPTFVIPDAFGDIFTDIVDTNYHIKTIFPIPAIWGRYLITGQMGNPADTTVTIWNYIQEPGRSYGA